MISRNGKACEKIPLTVVKYKIPHCGGLVFVYVEGFHREKAT